MDENLTELEKLRSEYMSLQAAPNLMIWKKEAARRAEVARRIDELVKKEKEDNKS